MVAWRLHATTALVHMAVGDAPQTEQNRAAAVAILTRLAYSLPEDEPLRESLLAAPSWLVPPAGANSQASRHVYMK
jgi:hypothetical protein